MREATEQPQAQQGAIGVVPTGFVTRGPKTVPRVDYERIFVLDSNNNLLGEYALDDDCPIESSDLTRSLPLSGMRHLVSFYQGEYAFTPFKVDDLWFIILTRGVPRIEERGSVGTLLAAARVHIPPMVEPFLTKKEAELRATEAELADREADLLRREQRAGQMEAEIQVASVRLKELEADVRTREAKLATLRDYAVRMQRSFLGPQETTPPARPKDGAPAEPGTTAPS